MYLNNRGGPSPDGGGSPFSFVSRRLMGNHVNIKYMYSNVGKI